MLRSSSSLHPGTNAIGVLLVLQVCATNAQELASLKEAQKVKEALERRTSGCGKGFAVIQCEFLDSKSGINLRAFHD